MLFVGTTSDLSSPGMSCLGEGLFGCGLFGGGRLGVGWGGGEGLCCEPANGNC